MGTIIIKPGEPQKNLPPGFEQAISNASLMLLDKPQPVLEVANRLSGRTDGEGDTVLTSGPISPSYGDGNLIQSFWTVPRDKDSSHPEWNLLLIAYGVQETGGAELYFLTGSTTSQAERAFDMAPYVANVPLPLYTKRPEKPENHLETLLRFNVLMGGPGEALSSAKWGDSIVYVTEKAVPLAEGAEAIALIEHKVRPIWADEWGIVYSVRGTVNGHGNTEVMRIVGAGRYADPRQLQRQGRLFIAVHPHNADEMLRSYIPDENRNQQIAARLNGLQ